MQRYHTSSKPGTWDLEIGTQQLANHHRRRRSWQRQAQNIPRWLKHTIIVIVAVCASVGLLRGFGDLHDQAVKQYPTTFEGLQQQRADLKPPPTPIRQSDGEAIDGRYSYVRPLAKGQEGSAALYLDSDDGDTVVVKTFNAFARNELPAVLSEQFADYTTTWPAEIEASLLLGAHDPIATGYVPIADYFILQTSAGWLWALVTPFLSNGTLVNLARNTSPEHLSTDMLDGIYRPSLARMLMNLKILHEAGYCHDDVKPDNIFMQSSSEWLLGDLGNIRHISHPWHSTRSWIRQNQWADCQLNDLRRAYKSYMWFLRTASSSASGFDRDFWAAKKNWSRLYWDLLAESHGLGAVSETIRAGIAAAGGHADHAEVAAGLEEATERELLCTAVPRRLWWWWEYLLWR